MEDKDDAEDTEITIPKRLMKNLLAQMAPEKFKTFLAEYELGKRWDNESDPSQSYPLSEFRDFTALSTQLEARRIRAFSLRKFHKVGNGITGVKMTEEGRCGAWHLTVVLRFAQGIQM